MLAYWLGGGVRNEAQAVKVSSHTIVLDYQRNLSGRLAGFGFPAVN